MNRLVTVAGAVVITALVTALAVVLTTGSGGVGTADAATENQNGTNLAAVLREQKAINKRLKVAILRSNRANKDTAANKDAIEGISTTAGAQGPQGVAGPPGVPGTPGSDGAPGPAGLADVSIEISGLQTLPGNATTARTVTCPAGKVAIGGGMFQTSATGNPLGGANPPIENMTAPDPTNPARWQALVNNPGATEKYFVVRAVCARVDS